MPEIVFKSTRIILALILLVFGSNKIVQFLPMNLEEIPEVALTFTGALQSTYTLYLVALIEILAAIAFLFNKYGALMALVLMSISVNAVLFHIFLFPKGLVLSLAFFIFNLVVLYGYRERYSAILRP